MPFVLRVVEPVYLSRKSLHHADGKPILKDGELDAVTNNTLAGAVRQLASLVLVAQDIFDELNHILDDVGQRSKTLRERIAKVEKTVDEYDPKRVPVPEGDLSAFSKRSRPFHSARPAAATNLFDASSRPAAVSRLYAAAAAAPIPLDASRRGELLCTPVLGRSRLGRLRAVDMDIETRVPAAIGEMRRWTSAEALGDVTVCPDGWTKIAAPPTEDHNLPTTEEQLKAIAERFPAQTIAVDVTGRGFRRMAQCRRSLIHVEHGRERDAGRRRLRHRRDRSHRRNTIAGTDQREIQMALDGAADRGETSVDVLRTVDDMGIAVDGSSRERQRSTEPPSKRWHLNSLRRWGMARLKAINGSTSGELRTTEPVDDINVYEAVVHKVKLREGSVAQRRKGPEEPPHSSSGNWSASSESGRASVTSESSHHPKSSTCSSGLPQRRRFINHSTSSSVTSEGTLTPEDMHGPVPFADDETSSAYSCDTEGYYTSFHVDSGLKTLKEEEHFPSGLALPQTPMHSSTALSNCSSGRGSANLAQLSAESEYELFGKGSTSTTTSSAGTVCTTLLVGGSNRSLSQAPAVPERKSSLVHHESAKSESPDSGHNTDSVQDAVASPIPSSCSEIEFSESSDLEGVDRLERIRVKTTINTSRIPSMCVITPPQSDDEAQTVDNTPTDIVNNNSITISASDSANNNSIKSDVANNNTPQRSDDPEAGWKLVSLDELPVRKDTPPLSAFLTDSGNESLERKRRVGARVMLDANGKVVYSSDSLRRRKGAHTTFEPGPFVKELSSTTPMPSPAPTPTPTRAAGRTPKAIIRPVNSQQRVSQTPTGSPSRIVIRAAGGESPKRMMHASTPTSQAVPPSLDCSGGLSPIVKSSLIAPFKSTMTAEQLYAAIHKSKKKMNIQSEPGEGSRATNAPPPSLGTSRYDFKRLLSQHGSAGSHKLSAVERLKVRSSGSSGSSGPPRGGSTPPPLHFNPATPKKWRRLATAQRSDVLSSTIVEDAAAEDQGNEDAVVIQHWTSSPMPARNLTWTRKSSLETAL